MSLDVEEPEKLVTAFLQSTTDHIIPLTQKGVESGCKVFGAAIFKRGDLSLVVAATNEETTSPLMHGEITTIQKFYSLPANERPEAKDCIFFSTHEPCSLCLSGITWGGFGAHFFLFTYEDTKDIFSIPYDIDILEEVYKVRAIGESQEDFARRPLYNKTNKYWVSASVLELIELLPEGTTAELELKNSLRVQRNEIMAKYNSLSDIYQKGKGNAGIPLA